MGQYKGQPLSFAR